MDPIGIGIGIRSGTVVTAAFQPSHDAVVDCENDVAAIARAVSKDDGPA